MPARITWRRRSRASVEVKSGVPQQLNVSFSIAAAPRGRCSATSAAVCPRPFGYCSVTSTGTPRAAAPWTRIPAARATRAYSKSTARYASWTSITTTTAASRSSRRGCRGAAAGGTDQCLVRLSLSALTPRRAASASHASLSGPSTVSLTSCSTAARSSGPGGSDSWCMPCSAQATVLRRLRTSPSSASAFSGDISGESLPFCAMPPPQSAYCRPAGTSRQSAKRQRRAAAARDDERVADLANRDAIRLRSGGGEEARHRLAERLLAEPERVPVDGHEPARPRHLEHAPRLLGIGVVLDPRIVGADAEDRDVDARLPGKRGERLGVRAVAREEHAALALRQEITVVTAPAVPRPAPSPMVHGHGLDDDVLDLDALAPADLDDAREAEIVDEIARRTRRDEERGRRETAERRAVETVQVRMRDEDRGEGRQLVGREGGAHDPRRADRDTGDVDADARKERRIGQDARAGEIDQDRRVADVGERQIAVRPGAWIGVRGREKRPPPRPAARVDDRAGGDDGDHRDDPQRATTHRSSGRSVVVMIVPVRHRFVMMLVTLRHRHDDRRHELRGAALHAHAAAVVHEGHERAGVDLHVGEQRRFRYARDRTRDGDLE